MATEKRRFMVSLTDAQMTQLEQLSKELGFTKSAIIALALEEWAEARRKKAASESRSD